MIANELAAGASSRGDDLTAIRQWQELAEQLKPDDPDERKWYLLALHRVEQLENAIKDRRQYVEKQLELAEAAFHGRPTRGGDAIKSKLVEQFSRYTDLADLFPATPVVPGSEPRTRTQPRRPRPDCPIRCVQAERSPNPTRDPHTTAQPTRRSPPPSSEPRTAPPESSKPIPTELADRTSLNCRLGREVTPDLVRLAGSRPTIRLRIP